MKILLLNHNLIWRGTFFRCVGFARELARRGAEVDLWTVSRERSWTGGTGEIDGVRVWRTPRWGGVGRHDGGYAPIDNLTRLAAASRGGWNVVHAFDHRPNVLLPWLWRKALDRAGNRRTAYISDWCDWWTAGGITTARRPFGWIDRFEQRIEEGSKRLAHGVTVISSALHERALSIGVAPNRLLTLPAGVMIDRFPLYDRIESRQALGLPVSGPILGFIGFSLWDIALLAEAFERIQQARPGAALLAIGGGAENAAYDELRRRFKPGESLFMPGVVEFDAVPRWLAACDAFLLPLENTLANRARVPNKLADFHAAGRPTAASAVGETQRLIDRYETGLCGEGAEGLAEAALRILDDPAQAIAMGERARRVAETDWSYEHLGSELLDFYSIILNSID